MTAAAVGRTAMDFNIEPNNQSTKAKSGERISRLPFSGDEIEGSKTTHDCLLSGIKQSGNGNCLGTRKGKHYEWKSYQQVYDQARQLGSALITKGLQPGEETLVGIYSNNREEWIITSESLSMFSMVAVPLYDTLGQDACTFIINQTEMAVAVCDTDSKVSKLLENIADTPSLKTIVVMEDVSNNNSEGADKCNVKVVTFKAMLELGSQNLQDPVPPKPESLLTVCYTSGTTGNPKGVMLTHKSIMSNIAAVVASLAFTISSRDTHFSYLPLAHMFERICSINYLRAGASIGFFSGDIRLLTEDMGILKPTIFITVPRLLNRIYDKVLMGVQGSAIKHFLFNIALSKKTAMLKKGETTNSSIWDKLVFRKVQNLMGGRVRGVIVGAAPLTGKVLNFSRCAFGCPVQEGYGQTEATAGVTLTVPRESDTDLVGPPLPCNAVKLIDVPEMDYYTKDDTGEVCVKGNNVMRGYYKDPEKTEAAFTGDGWLQTGDIGKWLPNGTLKIIDRRKHIFKLAQGEYVAPEKIEGIYTRSQFVAQAFVDGKSIENFVVGVIVLDPEYMEIWVKKQGISGTVEDWCNNTDVKKAVLDDVIAKGKEASLKGFEQVKYIYLCPEMFSVENDLLTPTFKSKRPALRNRFAEQIENMYQNQGATEKS